MVAGLQPWCRGRAQSLAVILHGWGGRPAHMRDLTEVTKCAFKDVGVDVYVPRLPYAFRLRSVRAETVVINLLNTVDQIIEERGPYERIIIVGHSLGALLARRFFLVAAPSKTNVSSSRR